MVVASIERDETEGPACGGGRGAVGDVGVGGELLPPHPRQAAKTTNGHRDNVRDIARSMARAGCRNKVSRHCRSGDPRSM